MVIYNFKYEKKLFMVITMIKKLFIAIKKIIYFKYYFFYSDKFYILFSININKFYKRITINKFILFHIIYNL